MIVTFDLFSALTDSRTGGAAAFAALAADRDWSHTGVDLVDRWDDHNKILQRTARPPVTFAELSRDALAATYADLDITADPDDDAEALLASAAGWPLWSDVEAGVRAVAAEHRVGILSNVDEELVRTTKAWPLVDPGLVFTSQLLGAYKPSAEIYRRAAAAVPPERLVHVAASARDVRGALEAGIEVVRLARPGHRLDPDGPQPTHQADHAADLPRILRRLAA